jgi:hypothetical protein
MSLSERRRAEPNRTRRTTGIVDVSDMTAGELQEFLRDGGPGGSEISIQRRGTEAFLLAE